MKNSEEKWKKTGYRMGKKWKKQLLFWKKKQRFRKVERNSAKKRTDFVSVAKNGSGTAPATPIRSVALGGSTFRFSVGLFHFTLIPFRIFFFNFSSAFYGLVLQSGRWSNSGNQLVEGWLELSG